MIRTSILPARNPAGRNQGIKNNAHSREGVSLIINPVRSAITLRRRVATSHGLRRIMDRARGQIIRRRRSETIKRHREIISLRLNHVMKCRGPISRRPKDIIPASG
ncbi:MAG TPA: hypothetical protein VGR76_09150 [Candidatus Angelobacter sp.]|jgi:hypothetical protein|nr:hypothetical protein [Candidatus Angelobacter sp.]